MEPQPPTQPIDTPIATPPPQPEPLPVNNHKKIPILLFILLLFLFAGIGFIYFLGKKVQPISSETSTEYSYTTPTGTEAEYQYSSGNTNTDSNEITTTYTNTNNGYQIQFPSDWKAIEDSDTVDIQSPNLALGNVTLSVLAEKPKKRDDQAIAIEVFKTNSFTSYTSQTDGMISRYFYIQLKNGQFLEILTRPVTTSNQQIFESMMDSFQLF